MEVDVNYLIALVAMPLLMVFWVLVQRWTAENPDEERIGGCMGCTCGKGEGACERELMETVE